MLQTRIWMSLILLSIFLAACSSQQAASVVEIATSTPVTGTPIPGNPPSLVPGAAPDFQAQPRQAFNLLAAAADQEFIITTLKWGRGIQLNQGGTLWLSVLVTLLVAFNFRKLQSRRNLDLVLLLLPGFFMVDLVTLGNIPENASQESLFGFLYLGLFSFTVILFLRALYRGFSSENEPFAPNLSRTVLAGLAIFLVGVNIFQALARNPDDAGAYTNIGAYHLLRTGQFPYGDPELRGGAAATYGPVLYALHIPFQLILQPAVNIAEKNPESILRRVIVGTNDAAYDGPPVMATKLAMVAVLLIAVIGLYRIGRELVSPETGWALICLFMGSAYVQGLGGEKWYITGVTYISHIAPAAITIWAFATLKRPWLSGLILALGAGALYYPVFFFPLWFGYYFWRKDKWVQFSAAFLVTCIVIFGIVLLMTRGGENQSAFRVIYESTVGHQEAGDAYGSSTFSFWSTQPGLTALWQKQLVPGLYLIRPSVLFFGIFLAASFFMARKRTISQFAFLTAAVAIAVQLWKSHAGGSYVEWYYPFFLIGLVASGALLASRISIPEPAPTVIDLDASAQSI